METRIVRVFERGKKDIFLVYVGGRSPKPRLNRSTFSTLASRSLDAGELTPQPSSCPPPDEVRLPAPLQPFPVKFQTDTA